MKCWMDNENNIKYKWSFERIVSFLGKDLDDIRDRDIRGSMHVIQF